MPPAFGREAQGWHITRRAQETQGKDVHGMARLDRACQVLYAWPWGNIWRRPRCELVPVTSVLLRHVVFLLSLLHLSHYKGALNVSKYLISSVSEWVCCEDDGWLGVDWVLEMPTAVPHPFPLTAFLLSFLPIVPP